MKAGMTWLQEMALRKKNLPVPVLAEPRSTLPEGVIAMEGEARESTTTPKGVSRRDERNTDSRGGQTPQQKWREKNKEKLAEYMRLYRAQKKLEKNNEKEKLDSWSG